LERDGWAFNRTCGGRQLLRSCSAVARGECALENNMKIGVLGSGDVAKSLARGFLAHGHEPMLGTRDRTKLEGWLAQNPGGAVGSFADAARFGELLVLAVKGSVAADALRAAGIPNLAGKPIVDTTNPIADAPPTNGVLKFFTNLDESLMERLQREFTDARFVKAFNSIGSASMVDPKFKGGKPTMFICGNDETAKKTVTGLLDQFGWETADMGAVEAARAIEPLCMLWCIPGFLRQDWAHAFKLLS
jgi:predicted dinucleotide-binding enzyme